MARFAVSSPAAPAAGGDEDFQVKLARLSLGPRARVGAGVGAAGSRERGLHEVAVPRASLHEDAIPRTSLHELVLATAGKTSGMAAASRRGPGGAAPVPPPATSPQRTLAVRDLLKASFPEGAYWDVDENGVVTTEEFAPEPHDGCLAAARRALANALGLLVAALALLLLANRADRYVDAFSRSGLAIDVTASMAN
jgi:hypothetical protein